MCLNQEIVEFLLINGWKKSEDSKENVTFVKAEDLVAVDLSDQEIVLIDDSGDFCHLPVNKYALIGALIHFRQIAINYNTKGV